MQGSRNKSEKISLGVNYRCAPEIVDASARLILHNKKRYKKLLESGRGECKGRVVFRCFDELEAQNRYIVKMLAMLEEEGVDQKKIYVCTIISENVLVIVNTK